MSDIQPGWEGKGRVAKQCRKTAMIAKQEQMANTADSSAHDKANPCGHPACIFVRKTAGRIDSRLTLPKLHLATLNVIITDFSGGPVLKKPRKSKKIGWNT